MENNGGDKPVCPLYQNCLEERLNCTNGEYPVCNVFMNQFYSMMTSVCGTIEINSNTPTPSKLLGIIRDMTDKDVDNALDGICLQNLKVDFIKEWQQLSENYMYDRATASMLNVDYAGMPSTAVKKIQLYSYCLMITKPPKRH